MFELRDYQECNLESIREQFADDAQRVLHQAPTGSGKGVLLAHIAMSAKSLNSRVIILGHRQEIVDQISDTLKALDVKHGMIAAGYPEAPELAVQVASVQTLARRLYRLTPAPDLLIIDESHHVIAVTWRRIIDALPDAHVLGFTATPLRLDGKGLRDVFEVLVIGPSVSELIEAGYLAKFTAYAPAVDPDLRGVRTRMGDFAVDQLAAEMSKAVIIGSAVEDYTRLCPGAPAIAFCVDIRHSQLVAERFAGAGYKAAHVDGETPREERRALIRALGNGELQVLSNCGLISEGLDVPGVVAAILLRPTKSLALYLQMVGRALRPAPGKERALILDHSGNIYRHGFPDAARVWSLDGKEKKANATGEAVVRRCKECGALNPAAVLTCSECGAELRKRTYSEIQAAELVEIGGIDRLRTMHYHLAIMWAGGNEHRLRLMAMARGYKPGWVWHQQLQAIRGMAWR